MKLEATEAEQVAIMKNQDSTSDEIGLAVSYWSNEKVGQYIESLIFASIMGGGTARLDNVINDVRKGERIRLARESNVYNAGSAEWLADR